MIKRVRLINASGELVFEADMITDSDAIIFCNSVYLRSFTQGTWVHYREITAERVRNLDKATAINSTNSEETNAKT